MVRKRIVVTALALLFVTSSRPAAAQRLHTFATVGSHTDDGNHYAGLTVGSVFDLAHAWISAGAAGDLFFSGGYVAGRGGPIAQLNFMRGERLRPFAIGGYKWGEGNGAVVGGGLEFRPKSRFGLRASIEDVLNRRGRLLCGGQFPPCSALPHEGNPYFLHGMSFQIGIVFP